MDVAYRIFDGYGSNDRLAALSVAGSVATGLADRWSDLELDCYWTTSPTNHDRHQPIQHCHGIVDGCWGYDETDREWSEDYTVGNLHVTVSNFTVATVEQFLGAVTGETDTDPVKHMRLSAIQACRPLRGAETIQTWKAQVRYPDRLADVMVERALSPETMAVWTARDALVERGDAIAVHALLSRIEQAVLAAVQALNRMYRSHRLTKWQQHLIAEFDIAPTAFSERLQSLWTTPHGEALAVAEGLLADVAGRPRNTAEPI
jgi:hypothetical protein